MTTAAEKKAEADKKAAEEKAAAEKKAEADKKAVPSYEVSVVGGALKNRSYPKSECCDEGEAIRRFCVDCKILPSKHQFRVN